MTSDSEEEYDPTIASKLTTHGILENCQRVEQIYKKSKTTLGSGEAGSVRCVCDNLNECNLVLKEQNINSEYLNEVKIMKKLTKMEYSFAPLFYSSFTCRKKGLIIMERTYKYNEKPTKVNVKNLCHDLYIQTGILHMDNHHGNVMCDEDGDLILIDFGLSIDSKNPNAVILKDAWHDDIIGLPRLREGKIDDMMWQNIAWSFMMMKINEDSNFSGQKVSAVTSGPYSISSNPLHGLKNNAPGPSIVICKEFPEFDRQCSGYVSNQIVGFDKSDFNYRSWYQKNGYFG
jgi:hypothetical protein